MRPALVRAALALGLATIVLPVGCGGPTPVETLRSRGDHSFEIGAYESASGSYREITHRYPGDWEAQYQLGLCALQTGEYAEAARSLQIALDRRPNDPAIADALAEAYYLLGDTDRLFAFLRDRADQTQRPSAWLRLGRYAMRTSDPDLARIALDTAIALDIDPTGTRERPPSVEPYLEAANLAEELGDLDEARRRLRQAYGLTPEDATIVERLRSLGEIPGPSLALPPGR